MANDAVLTFNLTAGTQGRFFKAPKWMTFTIVGTGVVEIVGAIGGESSAYVPADDDFAHVRSYFKPGLYHLNGLPSLLRFKCSSGSVKIRAELRQDDIPNNLVSEEILDALDKINSIYARFDSPAFKLDENGFLTMTGGLSLLNEPLETKFIDFTFAYDVVGAEDYRARLQIDTTGTLVLAGSDAVYHPIPVMAQPLGLPFPLTTNNASPTQAEYNSLIGYLTRLVGRLTDAKTLPS